jgi:DNA polymerase III subunit alpha
VRADGYWVILDTQFESFWRLQDNRFLQLGQIKRKNMFTHLRLHTEFSIADGTVRIDELATAAAADGQIALAVTDLSNLFAALKFYKAARAKGIKPLIGADLMIESADAPTPGGSPAQQAAPERLLLLVQNPQGYLNLCELISRAWTQGGKQGLAFVRWEWLQELHEGLIALSGAQTGAVGQALLRGDAARANQWATRLASLFAGRFYVELQRAGRKDDETYIAQALALAAQLSLPVVATHPVQFLKPDEFEAHEARVCIAEGEILGNQRRVRRFTAEQYFKSKAQMQALFADIPSALANTLEIAKRCSLDLKLGKNYLPDFPTPLVDGAPMPMEAFFKQEAAAGLEDRLALLYPNEAERQQQRPVYLERLAFETETIINMGFPGYFLIVADFINWAKTHGCPVGPGRGSGAGSLVAYALKITDLDPLQYKLLFERFLNPERVSMPDFDIDFCQANRDRVIDYVKDKYGRAAVSQIATFGTMAARAAIRDVGRVLDFSYTFCDGISKLIPNKPGLQVTIEKAKEMEPLLAERERKEEDVKTLLALAQRLEGLTRNVGMHAGGVLIAPSKLTDFCPLYQQPGSDSAVSQYDKDDVEAAGLVKFDFLGLATLTILERAKEFIVQRHPGQADFAFERIALDDPATYKLFADGKTEAVFQFESRGMQGMLRDARPTRLEDLIALNALYRPGPMDLIPSFIARKHGREVVEYPHPLVADMLSETYGIMVYQEQVMQTAQILGGYSLGGADLLRRAMGKKKVEEMAEHRAIFRAGAAKNNIDEHKADEIFDLMEKFAGYGFNKSHAAAYSLLAYHTAWIKVHYTAEFFCANMTVEMDNTDKLKVLFEDAGKMGIEFEPPNVNRGVHRFEPVSNQLIRYGLGAVKGTGQQAIDAIVAARNEGGAFKSLFDFCARVDMARINKRTVDALIKAGAFDCVQQNRAALAASIDLAFEYASQLHANANQGGLFDVFDSAGETQTQEPPLNDALPWTVKERLGFEKLALGFYLSGHLIDEVETELRQFAKRRLEDVIDSREPVVLAGIVSDLRVINGQRGRLAIFKLDDKSAVMEVTADEALLNANRHLLKDDELIIINAKAQPDRFSGGVRLNIQQIWDLPTARSRFGKYLQLSLRSDSTSPGSNAAMDLNQTLSSMQRLFKEFPPKTEQNEQGDFSRGLGVRVSITSATAQASLELKLGEQAQFYPTNAALAAWTALAAAQRANIVY